MGRRSTGVFKVEECRSIPISFLKEHNYLIPGAIKKGTLTFTNRGNPTGSINIEVNMEVVRGSLRLYYRSTYYNGKKEYIDYTIYLIAKESNLGRGVRWYFQCPITFKLCTTLHNGDSKYFKSRAAYNGLLYNCQTESKRYRAFKLFDYERKLDELYMKRGKTTYKGKPTRLQIKINKLEEKCNTFNLDNLRNWF